MQRISTFARRAAARFIPRLAERVGCTVCGHSPREAKLISGPGVYLCSDCFELAAKQLAPRHIGPDAERCAFCRMFRAPSDVTHLGALTICADCLGTMESVLAEGRQTPGPTTPKRD
jgi:hypothetical protein